MLNSRDIDLLRPDVAANCHLWVERCRAAGLNVLVTNTVRDREYQAYLYEQGRTRPGGIVTNSPVPTFHADTSGLAFDFCQNIKGQEYSDSAFFQRAGELGEQVGFEWGGRWKSFPDRPHLQWSDGGKYTSSMIRAGDYPPAMPPYREEDTDMTKEEIQAMIDAAVTAARPPVYTSVENCPAWARETVQKAVDEGVLRGDQGGGLRLTDDNLVNLQMLRNLGLLDGGGA